MSTQSYADIISDQSYNEGFEKGKKTAAIKLQTLKNAAKAFMDIYSSGWGEPECKEWDRLKKLISN